MATALLLWVVLLGVALSSALAFPLHHAERLGDPLGVVGVINQLVDAVGEALTGGSSNDTITGWTNATASDPCQDAWTGVLCTNGTITGLVLSGLGLVGSVPSSLGQIPGLTTIDMSLNDLSGSIPSLANLTQLLHLDLSNNHLNGSIPSLSDLTSLLTLDLSGNQLEGSIPSLSSLTSLTHLNLSHNLLSGSIPDLSALTSLVYLDLSSNNLSGIIPDLSALTSLQYLDLSNNKLGGAIPDLRNLTSLRVINLSGNNLTVEDLSYLALLSNLTTLVLSDNPLLFAAVGSIPSSLLDGVTSLAKLYLDNVGARGLLPDLALGSLELLSVESNLLCGALPQGLSEAATQGVYFAAGCNCLFESWCSSGACSNFKSYSTGALCDTSRCAQATGCPISATTATGSVLKFLTNVPNFNWVHPAPAGEPISNVTLDASLVSLTEIDQSGGTVHTEDFPTAGSYLISTNTTVRSNGASVDEITFKATLGNGAEVSVIYYISADADFTQLWGNTSVEVPRGSLKYTFNARGWPFASSANRLRLRMDLSSLPAVDSAVQNSSTSSSEEGTSDLSLQVSHSSASIVVQLYRHTLVYYSNVSTSVAQPSGQYRSEGVNSSLSADLGSVFVDFPWFDAAQSEVLSYDPSLGVLFGGDSSGRSEGSSDGSTWIIAVAVAVPVAVVVVVVAAVVIFGVGWWQKHNYVRRSQALRGSMINIAPDEGSVV